MPLCLIYDLGSQQGTPCFRDCGDPVARPPRDPLQPPLVLLSHLGESVGRM